MNIYPNKNGGNETTCIWGQRCVVWLREIPKSLGVWQWFNFSHFEPIIAATQKQPITVSTFHANRQPCEKEQEVGPTRILGGTHARTQRWFGFTPFLRPSLTWHAGISLVHADILPSFSPPPTLSLSASNPHVYKYLTPSYVLCGFAFALWSNADFSGATWKSVEFFLFLRYRD